MSLRQIFPDSDSAGSEAASIDIIAVHGLRRVDKSDAHCAWDTWQADDGRLWLRDDLPQHVPGSRVFLYEYDSVATYTNDQGTFRDKANELLEAIRAEREDAGADAQLRPIILLGHSIGGWLIKQALFNAGGSSHFGDVQRAVRSVAFFATPPLEMVYQMEAMTKVPSPSTIVGFRDDDSDEENILFADKCLSSFLRALGVYDITTRANLKVASFSQRDVVWFVTKHHAGLWEAKARPQLEALDVHFIELDADHRTTCRFEKGEIDQENLALVMRNVKRICLDTLNQGNSLPPKTIEYPRGEPQKKKTPIRAPKGRDELLNAACKGDRDEVRLLLESGIDIDVGHRSVGTPLWCAARSGHIDAAKLLLEFGPDIESKDISGLSPLMVAAKRHDAMVELLLEHGADIESKNYQYTPLLSAIDARNPRIASLLIEHGANVEPRDTSGRTPLSLAACQGYEDLVRLLLQEGADINARHSRRGTPLSWAVEGGHENSVKLLVEAGADVWSVASHQMNRMTPLAWITAQGSERITKAVFSTPNNYAWASREQNYSKINKIKGWVEDKTRVGWNWWPLSPRMRPLRNEYRIFWYCSRGTKQWREVSTEQYESMISRHALELWEPELMLPRGRRGISSPWASRLVYALRRMLAIVAAPRTLASSAGQRYTPTATGTAAGGASGGTASSSASHQSAGVTSKSQQQASPNPTVQALAPPVQPVPSNKSWILMGILKSGQTYEPAQITVDTDATDQSVFHDLKTCYQSHRSRAKLWFSIWRLDHCEFVKFNHLTRRCMVREYKDLPTQQDYLYDPRAGTAEATNPPVSAHVFRTFFYHVCRDSCERILPHECLVPFRSDSYLNRIPKRIASFDGNDTSAVWGFEAVFHISFAYVLTYIVLAVIGPFAFWGWWQARNPTDLQNAAVPIGVVLGLLNIFWGVITVNRGVAN